MARSGSLRWAVKPSFVRYVETVAAGSCEALDGAERGTDGRFEFPLLGASEGDEGRVLSFGGRVRFSAHHGFLDVDLRGLELRLTAEGAELRIADAQGGAVTIATMEHVSPLNNDDVLRWAGLVPRLTAAGAGVFGDVYPVGSELDPIDAAVPQMEEHIMALPTVSLDRLDPYHPPAEHVRLQSEAPISRVGLPDGRQVWVLTRHADVRAMLADPRFSSDRRDPRHPSHMPHVGPDHRQQLIEMDPPEHTRLRRSVVGEFTVQRLAAWRPRIQQIVDETIDAMLAGPSEVDLVEALSLPVPSMVISELLGVPYADHDFFQENSADFTRVDTTPEQKTAAVRNLQTYIAGLVQQKIDAPGDDLLSRRLAAGADREEVASLGFLLLIAGHETTANMISLSVATLLDKKEKLATLRENPELTIGAVEELLRYFSIAEVGAARLALADIEVGGVLIREGEGVLGLTNTANRDPEVFPEPDEIDFTRMARNHLAFGFGPHQCLGQNLARLELEIVLATLLPRVPTLRLAVPFDKIPFKEKGPNYGVYELKVAW